MLKMKKSVHSRSGFMNVIGGRRVLGCWLEGTVQGLMVTSVTKGGTLNVIKGGEYWVGH
jgi:hypothetical protein